MGGIVLAGVGAVLVIGYLVSLAIGALVQHEKRQRMKQQAHEVA
jgi:hypothetical protein